VPESSITYSDWNYFDSVNIQIGPIVILWFRITFDRNKSSSKCKSSVWMHLWNFNHAGILFIIQRNTKFVPTSFFNMIKIFKKQDACDYECYQTLFYQSNYKISVLFIIITSLLLEFHILFLEMTVDRCMPVLSHFYYMNHHSNNYNSPNSVL
jgi:hypothetical protein